MDLTSDLLSRYARELSYDDLPEEAVEKTKRLFLDSVGCSLGGFASPPSKILRSVYGTPIAGNDGARVIGSGASVPVEYAAFINSMMVRYLDYNDTYISQGRACHPSDHIPALLAVAESEGATGEELVTAIVLAYEIEGAGLDTGALWDEGYDYVTWGIYSCTAAVGYLMDLTHDQIVSAMGIAGSSSNALGIARRGDVTMWKGAAHPYVNHNSVQACQMARAGMTGPTGVFEGNSGVFETMAGGPIETPSLGGRDADTFRVSLSNVKRYACGYYMQTAVTATIDLLEEHDVEVESIESIEVETFEKAADVLASPEKWSTDLSRETADHSIPYTVAVAAIDGEVTPRQYRPARLRDARVHDLMAKVQVEENRDLTAYATEHPREIPAIVRVRTGNETYETRLNYPLGHASNPMTDEQIEEKVAAMAVEFLTAEEFDALVEASYALDKLERVDTVLDSLTV